MKRIFMMLSVLSLVILLSGCFGSDEVDEALDIFCSDNPDALVCTNPVATRNEIVANMFSSKLDFTSVNNFKKEIVFICPTVIIIF